MYFIQIAQIILGGILSTQSFFGLFGVKVEVFVAPPGHQHLDLLSVESLIVVADASHDDCVIIKFDEDVVSVGVMGVQCVQDGTQDTALWGPQC